MKIEVEKPGVNMIDAAARGAGDGLQLALNIGAMLIAFIGLIALVNGILLALHQHQLVRLAAGFACKAFSARIFAPVAWLLGVKYNDCATVGNLLGTRLILNEFVAFVDLGKIGRRSIPSRSSSRPIALCGFANLSSVAIQIGGIGALAPTRKSDLARLGLKAVAGRNDGEFHVGLHRGDAVMKMCARFERQASNVVSTDSQRLGLNLAVHVERAASRFRRLRRSHLNEGRRRSRQRPRRVRRYAGESQETPYGQIARMAPFHRRRSRGQAGGRKNRLHRSHRPVRPSASLRRLQRPADHLRHSRTGPPRSEGLVLTNAAGGVNFDLPSRRSGADLRSHQPDGRESADRAE